MQLNPDQQAAIRYLNGPLLVLAGAGSGKTRVITQKIAYLIQDCAYDANSILAVTFTNKAAREMKQRVSKVVNETQLQGLRISTFHNLGLYILRCEHKAAGYKSNITIFDDEDATGLLRELLLKKFAKDPKIIAQIKGHISRWKNELIAPDQAEKLAQAPWEMVAANVYVDYARYLHAYNAVDFDDLIYIPTKLLLDHEEILTKWQMRIRYMLVDEYQDTNHSQYQLVKLIAGIRGGLTVVGDDDQSIYTWRGARPENLMQLSDDFPNLNLIKLEQNYRSTTRILRCANHLISHNEHIFEKKLWSQLGEGELLQIISCKDEESEAYRVIAEITKHKFKHNTQFKDYAILYRGNFQARFFEKALREQNIPYKLSGGTAFFSRSEIKDLLAYFRLLVNPQDDAAFLRIINVPRRGIGPTTIEKLGNYAKQRNVSLLLAAQEVGVQQILSGKPLQTIKSFIEWLQTMVYKIRHDDAEISLKQLLQDIGYQDWLESTCSSDEVAKNKMGNVKELLLWVAKLLKQHNGDFADVVAKLTLLDMLENSEEDTEQNKVQLSTLHASKGLEYPYVFLVGMEEGLLPHTISIDEKNIAEERRLAYVGITRAQRGLTITFARQRKKHGGVIDTKPSRFLKELPTDDLQWFTPNSAASEENRQETGKAHLANIRELLAKK